MMTRICKFCEKSFETEKRYSGVCPNCKESNRKKKVMKTLNLL